MSRELYGLKNSTRPGQDCSGFIHYADNNIQVSLHMLIFFFTRGENRDKIKVYTKDKEHGLR